MMRRFRDILTKGMIELNTVLREFSGNERLGWYILDDNSHLFSPPLYREFCFPVLQRPKSTASQRRRKSRSRM